jgi:ATP-dependent DNA helicase RecQ
MAREYPKNEYEMEGIPGMGEKKRAEFASAFAAEIVTYLETNVRMQFS